MSYNQTVQVSIPELGFEETAGMTGARDKVQNYIQRSDQFGSLMGSRVVENGQAVSGSLALDSRNTYETNLLEVTIEPERLVLEVTLDNRIDGTRIDPVDKTQAQQVLQQTAEELQNLDAFSR